MKLTLMTNAFMFEPLDKALEQVARAGYRYVEIMCDRPHMYPGDFDAAAREKVRRRCADLGLEIVALDALHLHYESSGITPPTGVGRRISASPRRRWGPGASWVVRPRPQRCKR